MRIRRISFLGVRTKNFDAMTTFVSDVIWAAEAFADPAFEGFGWFFFRAPDGNVYVLQQERSPR